MKGQLKLDLRRNGDFINELNCSLEYLKIEFFYILIAEII